MRDALWALGQLAFGVGCGLALVVVGLRIGAAI